MKRSTTRFISAIISLVISFSSVPAYSAGAPMSSKNAKSLVVNALIGFEDPMAFDTGARDWTNYKTVVQAAISPTTYQARLAFDPSSASIRHFEFVTQQFGASRIPDQTATDFFRSPPALKLNQVVEEWKFWKAYREYLAATWTAPSCCTDPDYPCYDGCTYSGGETEFLYTTTCPSYGSFFFSWMNSTCTKTPSVAAGYISEEVRAFMESDLSKTEENLVKYVWQYHMTKKGFAWQYISDILRYMDVNGIESAWVDLAQDVVLGRQKSHSDKIYIPAQTEANGSIYRVQGSWMLSRNMVNTINSPAAMANANNSFTGATIYSVSAGTTAPVTPALEETVIEIFYANGREGALSDMAHSWQKSINNDSSCNTTPKQRDYDQLACIDKSHNWYDPKSPSTSVNNSFLTSVWPVNFTTNDTFGRVVSSLGLTPNPGNYDANVPQGNLYVIAYKAGTGAPVDLTTHIGATIGGGATWSIPAAAAAAGKNNIAVLTLSSNAYDNAKRYAERKTGPIWNIDDASWGVGSNISSVTELIRPFVSDGSDNQEMQGIAFNGTYPISLVGSAVKTRAPRNIKSVECLLNKNFQTVKVDTSGATTDTTLTSNITCDRSIKDVNDIMATFKAKKAYVQYVGRWEFLPGNTASTNATPDAEASIIQRYIKYNLCQPPFYDSAAHVKWNMVRPVYRFSAEKVGGNVTITPGKSLASPTTGAESVVANTWTPTTGQASPHSALQATFDDFGLISATGKSGAKQYVSPSLGAVNLGPITYLKRWRFDRDGDAEKMAKGTFSFGGQNFGFTIPDFRASSEEYDRPSASILAQSGNTGRADWVRPMAATQKSTWLGTNPATVLVQGYAPELSLLSGFTYPTSGGVDYFPGGIQGIDLTRTEEKREVLFGCAEMNLGFDLTPYRNAIPVAGTCTVTGAVPSDPYSCGGAVSQNANASTCGGQTFIASPSGGVDFQIDGFISTTLPNSIPHTGSRAGTAVVADTALVNPNLGASPDGGYYDGRHSGFPRADLNFYISNWLSPGGKSIVNQAYGSIADSDVRYDVDKNAHACGVAYQKMRYWYGNLSCTENLVPSVPATVPATMVSTVPKTYSCVVPVHSAPAASFSTACAPNPQLWYEDNPGLEQECEEYCPTGGGTKICTKRFNAWSNTSQMYIKQPECTDSSGNIVYNAGSRPADSTDNLIPLSTFSNRCMSPEIYNDLKGNGKW